MRGAESNDVDCSEPQRNVFNRAHRCVTCVLPCEGPETGADTISSGGQNGHRRWESGIDEEEHVWNEGRGALENVIGKSTSGVGDFNLDLA